MIPIGWIVRRRAAAVILCLTLAVPPATAGVDAKTETAPAPVYASPRPLDFLRKTPGDIRDYGRETFRRKNLPWILAVVGSTLVLIVADQYLVDKAHNLGDHLGITHTAYQRNILTFRVPGTGGKEVGLEGPFDSGSALYFIGDGWVDVTIAGSFLTYGLAKKDNRAKQTASQMAEAVFASGTVVQVLKHVTGRESPFTTDTPRGTWRFFPNQVKYAKNVPKYDAFPSGHLCAAMAVTTVIAENYPEHTYVRPVAYSLMGLLSFQMLNNGVHWASDYPLAIAMGYGFGKIAVRKGRQSADGASLHLYPMLVRSGGGVVAVRRFGGRKETDQ